MAEHNTVGQQGELFAQEYLRRKGYTIVETNWRCSHLEVDIIARTRREIVFVEVKTRRTGSILSPEEAVDMRRKERMTRAANIYIHLKHINLSPRFDIIAVLLPPDIPAEQAKTSDVTITHFEDAFPPVAKYY